MERSASFILTAQVLAILFVQIVTGQHTVANVTLSEIFFTSPGYVDGLNYGNNMTREYSFHTNYPGHSLQLKIVDFQLEVGDKNGNCLYDKVIIYDGDNESASVLMELCGTISPGTMYDSSNDTVYVVFSSDSSNTFKGFNISIVSDGPIPTTTPLSTTESSTTMTSSSTVSSSKPSASSSITANFTTGTVNSSLSTTVYPNSSPTSSDPTVSNSSKSSISSSSPISLTALSTTLKTTTTDSPASHLTSTLSTLLSTTTIYKTSVSSPSTSKVITVSTEGTANTTNISPVTSTIALSSTSNLSNMSTTSTTGTASNGVSTTIGTRDDDNGYIVWVIVACCLAGFLLLVVCVVVITRCLKKTGRAETKAIIHPIHAVQLSDNVAKSAFQNKSKSQKDITAKENAGSDPEAQKSE